MSRKTCAVLGVLTMLGCLPAQQSGAVDVDDKVLRTLQMQRSILEGHRMSIWHLQSEAGNTAMAKLKTVELRRPWEKWCHYGVPALEGTSIVESVKRIKSASLDRLVLYDVFVFDGGRARAYSGARDGSRAVTRIDMYKPDRTFRRDTFASSVFWGEDWLEAFVRKRSPNWHSPLDSGDRFVYRLGPPSGPWHLVTIDAREDGAVASISLEESGEALDNLASVQAAREGRRLRQLMVVRVTQHCVVDGCHFPALCEYQADYGSKASAVGVAYMEYKKTGGWNGTWDEVPKELEGLDLALGDAVRAEQSISLPGGKTWVLRLAIGIVGVGVGLMLMRRRYAVILTGALILLSGSACSDPNSLVLVVGTQRLQRQMDPERVVEEWRYELKNTSAKALSLEVVEKSCTCISLLVPKTIEPGAVAEVIMKTPGAGVMDWGMNIQGFLALKVADAKNSDTIMLSYDGHSARALGLTVFPPLYLVGAGNELGGCYTVAIDVVAECRGDSGTATDGAPTVEASVGRLSPVGPWQNKSGLALVRQFVLEVPIEDVGDRKTVRIWAHGNMQQLVGEDTIVLER